MFRNIEVKSIDDVAEPASFALPRVGDGRDFPTIMPRCKFNATGAELEAETLWPEKQLVDGLDRTISAGDEDMALVYARAIVTNLAGADILVANRLVSGFGGTPRTLATIANLAIHQPQAEHRAYLFDLVAAY